MINPHFLPGIINLISAEGYFFNVVSSALYLCTRCNSLGLFSYNSRKKLWRSGDFICKLSEITIHQFHEHHKAKPCETYTFFSWYR